MLTQIEIDDHTLNFQSHGTEEYAGQDDLKLHLRLNDGTTSYSLHEYVSNKEGTYVVSASNGEAVYKKFLNEYNYISTPDSGWIEDKIRIFSASYVRPDEAFSDDRTVSLEFNMIDALNEDISQIFATMDTFNNIIGIPANFYRESYPDLETLRHEYFKKLNGRLNFRLFADMLEFFDRSFVNVVRRLMPASVLFMGEEFVVESHMLERPKLQWNYRRQERPFQPEGVIKVYIHS
jgi:hypothetical protein